MRLQLKQVGRATQRLIVVATIILLLVVMDVLGGFDGTDRSAYDLLSTIAPPRPQRHDIVIVAIDEPSFSALGKPWPWPRQVHASLIRSLRSAGAKYVGFDVVFADPTDKLADDALARAADSRTILGADETLTDTPQGTMLMRTEPLSAFTQHGARTGVSSVVLDADGVVRHIPRLPDAFARLFAPPPTGQAQNEQLIQYFGAAGTYPYASFYQALNPTKYLPRGFFKNRDVVVGLVVHASPETRRADLFETSFTARDGGLVPGVEIQATIVDNLRRHLWITPAPTWVPAILLILGCAFGYGVATPDSLARRWGLFAATAVAIVGAVWLTLRVGRLWASPAEPLAGLLATFGALGVTDVTIERRRRRQVQSAFGQYLAPAMVDRLIADPELVKLSGERKCMTILFADVRGFTTISETMKEQPEVVTHLINQILSPLSDIVLRHEGTIDKYIGDCLMAFWNAPVDDPNHAKNAIAAAVDMIAALPKLNSALQTEIRGDVRLPEIAIGIGVNSGECIVGNMGTAKRFDYTVVGDPVNVAARLQSLSKDYGVGIVVGETTVSLTKAHFEFVELDCVAVRGTTRKQRIYAYSHARGDDAKIG